MGQMEQKKVYHCAVVFLILANLKTTLINLKTHFTNLFVRRAIFLIIARFIKVRWTSIMPSLKRSSETVGRVYMVLTSPLLLVLKKIIIYIYIRHLHMYSDVAHMTRRDKRASIVSLRKISDPFYVNIEAAN